MRSILQKKGQLSLGDAPTVVLLVGLVFLVMATIAFIGEKYGDALDVDDTAGTVTNESATATIASGISATLAADGFRNGACGTVTEIYNGTGTGVYLIGSNLYTQVGCLITNTTTWANVTAGNVQVTYPYTYSETTTASNATDDLNTEIGNNTSIAGIVLTISLVGIVLTILIGVFIGVRGGTTRV